MCLYDIVRFICTGEQSTLVARCRLAGDCVTHVRQLLHSTAVCDLCSAAWSAGHLRDEDYEYAAATSGEERNGGGGYFYLEEEVVPAADADAVEGIFRTEITMAMTQQERTRATSVSDNTILIQRSLRTQRGSVQPNSPASLPRRHSF